MTQRSNTASRTRRRSRCAVYAAAVALLGSMLASTTSPTTADAQGAYQRISGEGSSWSSNAIDDMRVNVQQFGITVDYSATGSTSGRKNWLNGTVDFAASDIPFQFEPEDGSAPENPETGSYAYIPVTAGGTAFIYNLRINGQRVTNLRLSGENVSRIFTGTLTTWNDPAIQADNPGIVMPARPIIPVVRSDGSGSSAQFTEWMIDQHPAIWQAYCERSGRAPACGSTSFYPVVGGDSTVSQAGDLGVANYVVQSFGEGAIGYVNYSYAIGAEFPVAKVLNKAGFYTEPTPQNVAVSLLQARINDNANDPTVYLTQELDGVYNDTDPRSYQLSSYSYFILPTVTRGRFTEEKGRTLAAFARYGMCEAQQSSASLGYSPLPINLVSASLEQIKLIPGAEVDNINVAACNNPTFSTDGTNVLAANAPQPQPCDRVDFGSQCPDGTAGAAGQPTAVAAPPASGGGSTGGGSTSGGSTGDGSTGGGSTGGATTGGATTGGGSTGGSTTGAGSTGGATTGGATTGGSATTGGATTGGSSGGATTGGATTGGSTGGATTGSGAATTSGGATSGSTTSGSGSGSASGSGGSTTGGATDGTAGGTTGGVGTGELGTPLSGTGDQALGDDCDPVTGVCGGGGGDEFAAPQAVPGPQGAPQAVSPVQAFTLDQDKGWGGQQALIVLVVIFTLGLIIVPPLVWRRLSDSDGAI